MADRTIGHEKIEMAWDFVVEEILSDETGNVSGVQMKNVKTGETQQIDCKGVFIAIGHIPNTGPFSNEIPTDKNGYFVPENGSQVKPRFQASTFPGIVRITCIGKRLQLPEWAVRLQSKRNAT